MKTLFRLLSTGHLEGGGEVLNENLVGPIEESFFAEGVPGELRENIGGVLALRGVQVHFPGETVDTHHVVVLQLLRIHLHKDLLHRNQAAVKGLELL